LWSLSLLGLQLTSVLQLDEIIIITTITGTNSVVAVDRRNFRARKKFPVSLGEFFSIQFGHRTIWQAKKITERLIKPFYTDKITERH
jgi:hypothetical protein